MAVVLEEIFDDSYEPSEREIREYAEWLGMNLEEDHELLWIARHGVLSKLPPEWKPCRLTDDLDCIDIFYFNIYTGASEWDHPCDDHSRRLYRRHKKLNAPVRVVSISGCFTSTDNLAVTCIGSLTGEALAVLKLKPVTKVRKFRAELAKELKVSKRRLRILLLDGRMLSQEDEERLLSDMLDIEAPASVEEEVSSNEEQPETSTVGSVESLEEKVSTSQLSLPSDLSNPFEDLEEAKSKTIESLDLLRKVTVESQDVDSTAKTDNAMCEATPCDKSARDGLQKAILLSSGEARRRQPQRLPAISSDHRGKA